jgi:hypothetical protein
VQWGIDTARANGINLRVQALLVAQNFELITQRVTEF